MQEQSEELKNFKRDCWEIKMYILELQKKCDPQAYLRSLKILQEEKGKNETINSRGV